MISKLTSAALLLLTMSGCAFMEQPPHYLVSVSATSNGVLLGEPVIAVEAGSLTSIHVDGDNGYDLSLRVTPTVDNQAQVITLFRTSDIQIAPTLLVEIGQQASVSVDGIELSVLVTETGG